MSYSTQLRVKSRLGAWSVWPYMGPLFNLATAVRTPASLKLAIFMVIAGMLKVQLEDDQKNIDLRFWHLLLKRLWSCLRLMK